MNNAVKITAANTSVHVQTVSLKKNLAIKEMPGSFSNDNDFRYVTRSVIRYLTTLRLPFFQIHLHFVFMVLHLSSPGKTLIKK